MGQSNNINNLSETEKYLEQYIILKSKKVEIAQCQIGDQITPCMRPVRLRFYLFNCKNSVCIELHTCRRYNESSCRKVENTPTFILHLQASGIYTDKINISINSKLKSMKKFKSLNSKSRRSW